MEYTIFFPSTRSMWSFTDAHLIGNFSASNKNMSVVVSNDKHKFADIAERVAEWNADNDTNIYLKTK